MSSVVDVDPTPPASNPKRIRLYILIAALVLVVVILGIAGISKLSGGTSRAQKDSPTLVAAAATPATETPTIVQPTEAPTRRPTNTPVVSVKETDTPVVKATDTIKPAAVSTMAPTTAPTQLAAVIVASPTPTPTEIPNTGLGSSGIMIGALLLVVLVFLARRLRVASEG